MTHQRHVSVPLVDDDGPPRTPAWMHRARCRGMNHEIFVDSRSRTGRPLYDPRAFQVCAACPVVDDCLTHAVDHCERGVWGGTTDAERRQIRRYKETT